MRVSIDTAVQRCEVRKVVQKVRGCRPCAGLEIHVSTYVVVVVVSELKGFAPPLFFSCSCSSLGGAALESHSPCSALACHVHERGESRACGCICICVCAGPRRKRGA